MIALSRRAVARRMVNLRRSNVCASLHHSQAFSNDSISSLEKGTVKVISQQDQEDFFDIEGGVIEVKKNKIVILSEPQKE